jgi:energy-coupling factor transport system substrate-specific component
MLYKNKKYWENIDLITIGTFAALIKVSTYLISICGGGMNPLTFILKNIMATALLVVLCYKVRKFGVLSLYILVTCIFGLLIAGGKLTYLPIMMLFAVISDALIVLCGGYKNTFALLCGIAFFDLTFRAGSLFYSYLHVREDPALIIIPAIMVTIGYFGCILGLPGGFLLLKELRHAGIVRQ